MHDHTRRLPILRTPGTPARFERLRFAVDPAGVEGTPGAPASQAGDPPAPEPKGGDKPLGEGGIKALQAERDARAAAEKALADLRKQIEDSKKSAEQKAADDLAAERARAERAEAERDSLRAAEARRKAAEAAGLPASLAERLVGTTPEELAADAAALKQTIGATPSGTPRPDPSQGGGFGGDHDPREAGKAEAQRRFGTTH